MPFLTTVAEFDSAICAAADAWNSGRLNHLSDDADAANAHLSIQADMILSVVNSQVRDQIESLKDDPDVAGGDATEIVSTLIGLKVMTSAGDYALERAAQYWLTGRAQGGWTDELLIERAEQILSVITSHPDPASLFPPR